MKTKDELNNLKQKTLAELETDLKAKKSELLNLRFQLATGQLENTAAIGECKYTNVLVDFTLDECKKDIARVKTIMRQREMAGKA